MAALQHSPARVPGPLRRRHWSDYVGFLATLAFVSVSAFRAPQLTFFVLPVVAFDLASAFTFLTRGRPVHAIATWPARVVAYCSAFILPAFSLIAAEWRPEWVANTSVRWVFALGLNLWIVGLLGKLWSLWYLRSSFSIEPAARRLVTTGPYALARHPIYAGHFLTVVGLILMHSTPAFVLLFFPWAALLWRRARYEEATLETAFPEYREYRARVAAFGPRFWASERAAIQHHTQGA
jgi:protein-S-isoprenylcysteine O-methyltransferase Ste14